MKYDFTSLIDRHGMDAIAVDSWGEIPGMAPNAPDEGFDRIPMWVADMNFATVPTVQEHIIQRAQHPMFGYFDPRDEYFDRIIEWQSRRNGVEGLLPEHIGYENEDNDHARDGDGKGQLGFRTFQKDRRNRRDKGDADDFKDLHIRISFFFVFPYLRSFAARRLS